MKRIIIPAVLLLCIFSSLALLSGCEFSMPYLAGTISESYPDDLGSDHYLNDPNINFPDEVDGEGEDIAVGEDGSYEIPDESDDENEEYEEIPPISPLPNNDILLKSLINNLNIRSGPGTSHSTVGTMKYGAMVPYIATTNSNWYETTYKGKKAYVSNKYIQQVNFEKASVKIEKVIDEGKLLLGFPYIYGAQRYHWGAPKAIKNTDFVMGEFDCSSLTQYAYYKGAGVVLDLTTRTQIYQGKHVEKSNLRRGDLMFFTNSSRQYLSGNERVGHVAIYLGDNYILHTASDYATIEAMNATRWKYYISSRRFLD